MVAESTNAGSRNGTVAVMTTSDAGRGGIFGAKVALGISTHLARRCVRRELPASEIFRAAREGVRMERCLRR